MNFDFKNYLFLLCFCAMLQTQEISSWSAKKRFCKYFATVAKISKENLPVSKNSASGIFRNKVASSYLLSALKNREKASDNSILMEIFLQFYQKFHGAFSSGDSLSWTDSYRVIWPDWIEFELFLDRVTWAMSPLLTLEKERQAWRKKIRDSALESFIIIQSRPLESSGYFLNGWMLVPIEHSGKSTLELLEQHFPNSQDAFIQALKNTFAVFLEIQLHVKKFSTGADLQLKFQILFEAWESMENILKN